jgi:hypothetical protein
VINKSTVTNITATNNILSGIYVYTSTATSTIDNFSLSSSNATGNTGNGVYIRKTSGSTLNADLGGGGLSAGQNRIFGNTGNDLNIDRATISAASNWWNNGGASPTRVTLSNGGTATYTPNLPTDPRP